MKKPTERKYYWDVEYLDEDYNSWFSVLSHGPVLSRRNAIFYLHKVKKERISGVKLRVSKFVRAK